MHRVLFFKAHEAPVTVAGHMRGAVYVHPYIARRMRGDGVAPTIPERTAQVIAALTGEARKEKLAPLGARHMPPIAP